MSEDEWWCWCGSDQAEDGCCAGDSWHIAEPFIIPALKAAIERSLDSAILLGDQPGQADAPS